MIQQLLGLFKDRREIFDLNTLQDPVALVTLWDPLVSGGSNFCSHRLSASRNSLKAIDPDGYLQMKVTPLAILFNFILIGFGLVPLGLMALSLDDPSAVIEGNLPPEIKILLPFLFIFAGAFSLQKSFEKNITFDKRSGIYTKNKINYRLSDVHAIQLIREHVRASKSNFYSYEMNLVLNNGQRFNVTDHGSRSAIRSDAKELAQYLNVPLWVAINYRVNYSEGMPESTDQKERMVSRHLQP